MLCNNQSLILQVRRFISPISDQLLVVLHHRWSNHVSVEIKTGRPDRIKGGITLLFWLIDLQQQKKVASLPRSTVAEKKQISWLNLFIKHCYYHHLPRLVFPGKHELADKKRAIIATASC